AAGFRIVRGRGYTRDEVRTNAPVAVISESVARDFFNGAEPIGATLAPIADSLSSITIVGVAAEALTTHVRGRGNGAIYRPLAATDRGDARLVVRAGQPAAVAHDVEKALRAVDSRVRVSTTIMSQDAERYLREPRILAGLSATIAGLALLLAVL